MSVLSYIFQQRPSITYAITVCNEIKEIENLLNHLLPNIRKKDEIIVLQDITIRNGKVTELLKKYGNRIKVHESRLDGDFSKFKNQLIPLASGDYLFQIDADELLPIPLIKGLPGYIALKSKHDCFSIPRLNTVEGITEEHIRKWNWEINADGHINYPDFQTRIFKLKTDYPIQWVNKVHEELQGFQRRKWVGDKGNDFAIIHKKLIQKQEEQNDFYDKNF